MFCGILLVNVDLYCSYFVIILQKCLHFNVTGQFLCNHIPGNQLQLLLDNFIIFYQTWGGYNGTSIFFFFFFFLQPYRR